jgi:hypothetical protein
VDLERSGDADRLLGHRDHVAAVELAAAAGLGLAVHRDLVREQQLACLAAAVGEAGQLEQLSEPDHLAADLDVTHAAKLAGPRLGTMRSALCLTVAIAVLAAGCGDRDEVGRLSPAGMRLPVEVWAVGDAADDTAAARLVARMVRSAEPDALLYLGDVYGSSRLSAFHDLYDPLYGSLADRTVPTPGNHEWPYAREGYFPYWEQKRGRPLPSYLSRRIGGWQVLSLNSNLRGRAFARQLAWARERLRRRATCRLAIWHAPRFSASAHGDAPDLEPLWRAVRGRARIVVNGHDHGMQRLRPIGGTTIFVSGAGGRTLYPVDRADRRLAFFDDRHFGALRMRLRPRSAAFAFVDARGRVRDSGRLRCRS